MARANGEAADVERVKRLERLLNDARSQDVLRHYLREVEYDMVFRAGEPEREVTI